MFSPGPDNSFPDPVFAGDSDFASRLRLQVTRIAPHFRVALLVGERGCGKQAVAQQLHRSSPLAHLPLVAMEALAFSSTPLEFEAGIVLLEGVSVTKHEAQLALLQRLRQLQTRRELRVIVSSDQELRGLVSSGRLLPQLFEAIGSVEIRLAPLRERQQDLAAIAKNILAEAADGLAFSADALSAMAECTWPANIPQLRIFCTQAGAAAVGGLIERDALPAFDQATSPGASSSAMLLQDVIERHVMTVLEGCAGNKLRAAELLGISRSTLYRMLSAVSAT